MSIHLSFRKTSISLLLIFVMLLNIPTVNTYSAGAVTSSSLYLSPTISSGEQLRSWGIIYGYPDGSLGEENNLTRAEMVVIMTRMLGEYNQANSHQKKSTFIDGQNHWAESYVAYAQSRGWTSGIGNNMFGYEQKHTAQEAAVFMLKALGYIADKDFNWFTAYEKATQLGLITEKSLVQSDNITRGSIFSIMVNTIYAKDVNGIVLGEKLSIFKPTLVNVSVTGITLDSNSLGMIVGETERLSAVILPENATNKNVNWTSNNPYIANVSAGVISANSPGTAVITATTTDGNKTSSCTVSVFPEPIRVTGVSLDRNVLLLTAGGESVFLSATIYPYDATKKDLIWQSSQPDIASVINGKVTPLNAGTTTINVKTDDGNHSASCVVTVEPAKEIVSVTGVALDKETMTLELGQVYGTIFAEIYPTNADNSNIIWTSSNPDVARITNVSSNAAEVLQFAEGTTTITAQTEDGGFSAICVITVIPKTPIDFSSFQVIGPGVYASLDITQPTVFEGDVYIYGNLNIYSSAYVGSDAFYSTIYIHGSLNVLGGGIELYNGSMAIF